VAEASGSYPTTLLAFLGRLSCEGAPSKGKSVAARWLAVAFVAASALVISAASGQAQNNQNKVPSAFGPPKPLIATPPPIDQAKPMLLNADELLYDNGRNRVTARGNVEMYYNNYTVFADQITYDQGNGRLEAQGNVRIQEPNGAVVNAEKFEFSDDFRDGFAQNVRLVTKEDARISAGKSTRLNDTTTIYERGFFTPCKACKDDPSKAPLWQIKAVKITHKQDEGTIYYEGAQLEFFGVPFVYLPYFSTPDPSTKRKSGFLFPEAGHSNNLGYHYAQPFYWALAPNYEVLPDPKYTTKQGILWQGEWRHRLQNGEYWVKGSAIQQDAANLPLDTANRQDLQGFRGTMQTRGKFSLSSWWSFGWDVTLESDDTFRRFYGLDSVLKTDRVSEVYLIGQSERNFFSMRGYVFGGLVANTNGSIINDTSNTASRVAPIVDYNYVAPNPILGGELSFDGNAMALTRNDGTDVNRVIAQAKWRRQMIDSYGQVFTPFARARGDVYQIGDVRADNPALEPKSTVARVTGAAGVTYEYPFVSRTQSGAHVLTPVAQFIARPETIDQKGIPNEDAKSLIYSDALLFEVDKSSGYDRVETGSRANVGLQYTFQANKGGYTRVIAGQSYQVSGENPYTVGTGLDKRRSDYVLGLYYEPSTVFRFLAQSRFDSETLDVARTDLFAYVGYGPIQSTGNYAFNRKNPADLLLADRTVFVSKEEALATLQLKLTDHWYLFGSARYDIENNRLMQDTLGIKYLDECFMLSTTYTETFYRDRDVKPDKQIMLRFELKHLGGFNYHGNPAQTLATQTQTVQNISEQPITNR
jgi:LPS-assembly protein